MVQNAMGTIDPTTTSGTDLAALLTAFGLSEGSNRSGATRPADVTAGGLWTQLVSSTVAYLNYYDGTVDIIVMAFNPTTHLGKTPSAATADSLTSGSTAVPNTRQVNGTNSLAGGGALSADLNLTLLNDNATPGNNRVYGTDGSGTKGWQVPSAVSLGAPHTDWNVVGSYLWIVPSGVIRVQASIYGAGTGGSTPPILTASIPVTPGASMPVVVGAQAASGSGLTAGTTSFGGYTVTGSSDTTSGVIYPPSGADYFLNAKTWSRNWSNAKDGLVIIEYLIGW